MQAVMSTFRSDTKKDYDLVSYTLKCLTHSCPSAGQQNKVSEQEVVFENYYFFKSIWVTEWIRSQTWPCVVQVKIVTCVFRGFFSFTVELLQHRVRHGPTFLQIIQSPEGPMRGLDRPPTFYAFTASPASFCLTPITMSLWRFRPQRV